MQPIMQMTVMYASLPRQCISITLKCLGKVYNKPLKEHYLTIDLQAF